MRVLQPIIFFAAFTSLAYSEDLDALLEASTGPDYTQYSFKSTQLIHTPTTEQTAKGDLQLIIGHRFGGMNASGADGFWGMDQASIRLSLDLGLTDWLQVGFARANDAGTPLELSSKVRLLRQRDDGKMPLSLSWSNESFYQSAPDQEFTYEASFSRRLSSVQQLLLVRKFNPSFSMLLAPGMVWRNVSPSTKDANFAPMMALGWRLKASHRVAWTGDVSYALNIARRYIPAAATGVEIETGGHVFQLNVSTASAISYDRIVSQTIKSNNGEPDLHFGFAITRAWDLW
jgi:hypothetical protein